MRNLTITIFFLGLIQLASNSFGQESKVNLVIQLNDKLVIGQVAALHIYIETDKDKFNLDDLSYDCGDLILSEQIFKILKFDSVKSATLIFDLYSYEKDKQKILNVKAVFSKFIMEQPYAILNVYDLRDKKNKRQLGYLTKEDYICEYIVPNGGRLIRRR